MDEQQLLELINSLPLSVQQSMIQYMMAGGDPNVGGTAPFGAGPMNTGRTAGQFQGPLGVSPYDPMSAGAAYAYTPQLDSKGREQPFDLGTAQQNLNYIQDAQGNLFNNAFMMQGGEGVYAPGTFDAQYEPGEYDMLLQSALGQGPTTFQGFIADRIAKGEDPNTALNNFWAVANDPENPASATLKASLPTKYVQVNDPETGAPSMQAVEGGDMEAPQYFAQQLTEAQMKQGMQTPTYGAIAQDFIDKGIPFPTERYGQGQYSMEAQFPEWANGGMSAITAAQRKVEDTRKAADPAAIQRAQAKYLTGAREANAVGTPQRTAPKVVETPQGQMDVPDPAAVVAMPWNYSSEQINASQGGLEGLSPSPTTAGVKAEPVPGMLPTTTGRSANRIAGTMGTSARRAAENAQKELRAAQERVWSPQARDAYARNMAMNKLGRTPTQDTLMARQLVNYMMGVYGPRG